MSKHEKLMVRLTRKPPPKDFTWEELITLMTAHGFTVSCGSGSHHRFAHPSRPAVIISKTHPDGLLKPYQIKVAIEALESVA